MVLVNGGWLCGGHAGKELETSPIPGYSNLLVVMEHGDYSQFAPDNRTTTCGHCHPSTNHVLMCIDKLNSTDDNLVFDQKNCLFDVSSDPGSLDVDGNGIVGCTNSPSIVSRINYCTIVPILSGFELMHQRRGAES